MQLLPKDEKFFDLFVGQAEVLKKSARMLREAAASGNAAIRDKALEIGRLEKEGDDKMREILERLNRTFITPIDPEDVSQIASGIENLTDQTEALAFRLSACNVEPFPKGAVEATRQFDESAGLIGQLFEKLQQKQMDAKEGMREDCAKIRHIISAVVCQTRDNLRDLYGSEKDPLTLIKVKDIHDAIAATARTYEKFTDAIQNVIAKNT